MPKSFSKPLKGKLKRLAYSVNFDHYCSLTDDTGMLQHSKFSVPDRRFGYTTDDNARALVISTRQFDLNPEAEWSKLSQKFLAFLVGMQRSDGRFHNFMTYNREVEDDYDSGDHLGRALWALGCVVDSTLSDGMRASAKEAFDRALPWALQSTSVRVRAHAIKGLCRYVSSFREDQNAKRNISCLANKLVTEYQENHSDDWKWFENILAYENWRLAECLFEASQVGEDVLKVAEESLRFLIRIEFVDGTLVPVGSNGWYPRNSIRAEFDQLPVEAGSAVEALTTAAKTLDSEEYRRLALHALEWYHGRNIKNMALWDVRTGACYDGLSSHGLNLNQGAESTLSYLLAATSLQTFLDEEKI